MQRFILNFSSNYIYRTLKYQKPLVELYFRILLIVSDAGGRRRSGRNESAERRGCRALTATKMKMRRNLVMRMNVGRD